MRCQNYPEIIVVPNDPVRHLFQVAIGVKKTEDFGIAFFFPTDEKVIEIAKKLFHCRDVPYVIYELSAKTITLYFDTLEKREQFFK